MPKFGKTSNARLATCHPDLQLVFNEVIKHVDCSIIQGVRSKEDQDEYFRTGKSKLKWPNSKHNVLKPGDLSRAVDVAPYLKNKPHIRWDEKEVWYYFAGFVMSVAAANDIKLRWGGNWDCDDEFRDNSFMDLPHFELL